MVNQDLNIVSPCIGVCKLGHDNICLGCLRTPDEIRLWRGAGRDVQLEILGKLRVRRRERGLVGRGERNHRRRRGGGA